MRRVGRVGQDELLRYSAVTFRVLLDSLARPGKVNHLELHGDDAPASDVSLNMYALGAFLSLLDKEVTFAMAVKGAWLASTARAVQWVIVRSGAKNVQPGEATFAFFCDSDGTGLLRQLNMGTLLEPELSATAFYCVERLLEPSDATAQDGLMLELAGPGIAEKRVVHVEGLSRAVLEQINSTRSYPLGIDIYMIDAMGRCIGLPRTSRIQIVDATDRKG